MERKRREECMCCCLSIGRKPRESSTMLREPGMLVDK